MASPTELAREAITKVEVLRAEFDVKMDELAKLNLIEAGQQIAILRDRIHKLEISIEQTKPTRDEIEEIGALKNRVSQLEDHKKLADTRIFQFIMLFIGGVITLLVQLIILFVKK